LWTTLHLAIHRFVDNWVLPALLNSSKKINQSKSEKKAQHKINQKPYVGLLYQIAQSNPFLAHKYTPSKLLCRKEIKRLKQNYLSPLKLNKSMYLKKHSLFSTFDLILKLWSMDPIKCSSRIEVVNAIFSILCC